jgi:hypothetical protein
VATTARLKGTKNFPAKRFREAIRGVWDMAATPDEQRLTFGFNEKVTSTSTSIDGEGVAFDPRVKLNRTTKDPVVVPCGVEYRTASGESTPFGVVSQPRLAITLFDEDYALIEGADWVEIEDERYLYAYDEPPTGLFQVGLHTLVFQHEAEH